MRMPSVTLVAPPRAADPLRGARRRGFRALGHGAMILRAAEAVLYLSGCPARRHVARRPGSRPLTSAPLEAPPFMNALADLSQSRDLLGDRHTRGIWGH